MSAKTIEIAPRNPNFLDTYGWILFELGEYEEAVNYLQKALAVNAESATIADHLGDALVKTGKKSEAIAAYRKALAIDDSLDKVADKISALDGK